MRFDATIDAIPLHMRKAPGRRRTRHDHRRSENRRTTLTLPSFLQRAKRLTAELMALCPTPPSPPRRSHPRVESRQERLSRWRFDILIAATAMVTGFPLIHHNPQDFENLRGIIERFPERFPGVDCYS